MWFRLAVNFFNWNNQLVWWKTASLVKRDLIKESCWALELKLKIWLIQFINCTALFNPGTSQTDSIPTSATTIRGSTMGTGLTIKEKRDNKVPVIVGGVAGVGVIIIILLIIMVVVIIRKRRKRWKKSFVFFFIFQFNVK